MVEKSAKDIPGFSELIESIVSKLKADLPPERIAEVKARLEAVRGHSFNLGMYGRPGMAVRDPDRVEKDAQWIANGVDDSLYLLALVERYGDALREIADFIGDADGARVIAQDALREGTVAQIGEVDG